MDSSNGPQLEVEDTSQKVTLRKRFSAVFGKKAPHSGFNKFVAILAFLTACAVIATRSGEEEADIKAASDRTGYIERGNKGEVVPEHVAKEEIKKDQANAGAARTKRENYFGARPNTGKISIDEALKNAVKKPIEEPAPEPEEQTPAATPVFTHNPLDLDSAKRAADNKIPEGGRDRTPSSLEDFAKKLIESGDQDSSDSSFANGLLVEYEPIEPKVAEEDSVSGQASTNTNTEEPAPSDEVDSNDFLALHGGHFTYGYTVTAVDTDVAVNTVVAELMGGNLDGARITGTWSRLGNIYEDLSLVFNTMDYKGERYQVNLVAFSTSTHLPAFVSEVDRHLLYRWGGLLSGALLEAAQAAALASATLENPTSTEALVNATESLTDEDVTNIFISEAGSRTAEQLKENYQRPITSRVFVGQDMRLLAMEPVYVKSNKETD